MINLMNDWLDLKDAAAQCPRLVESSLRRLCNTGEIAKYGPAQQVPWGRRNKWQIHISALAALNGETISREDYDALVAKWKQEQASGYHTGSRLAESTVYKNASGMASFWKYLGTYDPETEIWTPAPSNLPAVTIENIRRAMAAVPATHKAAGHNIYWGARSFYYLLVREGLRPEVDLLQFQKFKPQKNPDPKRTFIKDDEQWEALIQANEDWRSSRSEYDRLLTGIICKICYYTAMRIGEVCGLTLGDVNLSDGIIFVGRSSRTKTGESRPVGICPELEVALRLYLHDRPASAHKTLLLSREGTPLKTRMAYWRVRNLSEHAKIPIRPHGFRRSFATGKLKEGIPANLVMKIGGWKRLATLQQYDMTTEEDALDVLRGPRQKIDTSKEPVEKAPKIRQDPDGIDLISY